MKLILVTTDNRAEKLDMTLDLEIRLLNPKLHEIKN